MKKRMKHIALRAAKALWYLLFEKAYQKSERLGMLEVRLWLAVIVRDSFAPGFIPVSLRKYIGR